MLGAASVVASEKLSPLDMKLSTDKGTGEPELFDPKGRKEERPSS